MSLILNGPFTLKSGTSRHRLILSRSDNSRWNLIQSRRFDLIWDICWWLDYTEHDRAELRCENNDLKDQCVSFCHITVESWLIFVNMFPRFYLCCLRSRNFDCRVLPEWTNWNVALQGISPTAFVSHDLTWNQEDRPATCKGCTSPGDATKAAHGGPSQNLKGEISISLMFSWQIIYSTANSWLACKGYVWWQLSDVLTAPFTLAF